MRRPDSRISIPGFVLPADRYVVNLEQTQPKDGHYVLPPLGNQQGGIMADPKNSKHREYARYAAHCLGLAPALTDHEDRSINREMAAEWLKLAEAIVEPSKTIK